MYKTGSKADRLTQTGRGEKKKIQRRKILIESYAVAFHSESIIRAAIRVRRDHATKCAEGRQVTGIRARSEEPEEQDGHKKEAEVDLTPQRKEGPFYFSPHAPGFEDSVNYVWA